MRKAWVGTLALVLVGVFVGAQVGVAELVFRVERVTGDLWAKGWIETSTGFKFPDGTTMTTAAVGNGNGWSLTGNSGTNPDTHFLGTTDDVAFEIRVNNVRALRIVPRADSPNIIGGYHGNTVGAGVYGATISGGGMSDHVNRVTSNFGTVGGGGFNTASGEGATVAGGGWNWAGGEGATVGGGGVNTASGDVSTVSGGEDNTAAGDYATVSGGIENTASSWYATVAGGYRNTASDHAATVSGGDFNAASDHAATVGGGDFNTASGVWAAVGGGHNNTASGERSTVAGGIFSSASGDSATVAGGYGNTASGEEATVGGGHNNTASGERATVAGGFENTAAGDYSFAAGRGANADHDGSFVWADGTGAGAESFGPNYVNFLASGGFSIDLPATGNPSSSTSSVVDRPASPSPMQAGDAWFDLNSPGPGVNFIVTSTGGNLTWGGVWQDASDRALKENFEPVDKHSILEGLAELPITRWNYIVEGPDIQHVGPVAQDFYEAFQLGTSDRHLDSVNTGGVAFVAIQALYERSQEQDERIEQLTEENAQQAAQIAQLTAENEEFRARLEALEALVQGGE